MKKLALFSLLGILFLGCSSEPKSPPNIIIFLADDLGYGDLPSYGNPIIKTPNIDRLASEGVLLTDCHSGGTVCSPSRAALLTGRNPYRSGFYYISGAFGSKLEDSEITIPELLKSKGYQSAFMGKWHLSRLEKDRVDEPGPGEQGFDYWFSTSVNAFEGPENPQKFFRNGKPTGTLEGWYIDLIVQEANEWLFNRDKKKPFFLMVSTHEPHTPLAPPEKYSAMYDNRLVDSLEKSTSYGGVDRPEYDIAANKKEYYGTVTQLDDGFGELMKTLDALGERENTIVIFTSDNGPEHPVNLEESQGLWEDPIRDFCFGTPGIYRGMKRYPYEGGHRVPGIVRWPSKIPAGSISDKLINGTDFLPFIANLAGIELPKDRIIDGIDIGEALLNKEVHREVPVLWAFPTHEDTYFRMPHLSLRAQNYTLMGWLPEKPDSLHIITWMKTSVPTIYALYDLTTDPSQTRDLSEQFPQLTDSLKQHMIAQWLSIRDEKPWVE